MEAIREDPTPGAPFPLTMGQRVGFCLVMLPAAVVPFIAFGPETSPARALWHAFRYWRGGEVGAQVLFVLLASPFLLGPVIALAQLRLLFAVRLTRVEQWLAAAMAGVSGSMTLLFAALGITLAVRKSIFTEIHWMVAAVLIVAAGGIIGARSRRRASGAATRAFAALLLAYLANAAICLVGFFDGRQKPGWWLTLVVAIGMTLELFALARRPPAR